MRASEMKDVLHKADTRGLADHGWLLSRHTFSFADYVDRKRMNFGLLRVLNDDVVAPGMGFGTHPHANMEIISIPLSGALLHHDSMGNRQVIEAGEVQVMSAGTGLTHSEYNNSDTEPVSFLQIWIYPREQDIAPRYGQRAFDPAGHRNRLQLLVSPDRDATGTIWINQDAWLSMAALESGATLNYQKYAAQSGVYFFVIDGELEIAGNPLEARDGLGLAQTDNIDIIAQSAAKLLSIEIPMADR